MKGAKRKSTANHDRNAAEILHEISDILETGLEKEHLNILLEMCENGVDPNALAAVVKELRRESSAMVSLDRDSQQSGNTKNTNSN